jgi:hypothetical protein
MEMTPLEASHPDPFYNEVLQQARFEMRRRPMLRRFCEKLDVVVTPRGPELRIDWHGPGTFECHAALRLPVSGENHVSRAWVSDSIRDFHAQCEQGWVAEYDKWLAKREAPAVGDRVELVQDLGPPHRPEAQARLIRELTYSECIEAGCSEAEALDYVKTSKPPRVIYEAPSEPEPAAPAVVPPEGDPENDELWP